MEDRRGCGGYGDYQNIPVSYKEKNKFNDSHFEKCPKPKRVVLECGHNPQDAIFEIDDDYVEEDQSFVLDRLTIDTLCLDRPVVKIEFSSLVFFEAESEDEGEHEIKVDLLFKLIRICDKDKECIQTWRYLKGVEIENSINELEIEISEPFTVTHCDRPCPADCCEYIMVVEGKDFEGEFEALRVVKPNLSAIAQGQCCCD